MDHITLGNSELQNLPVATSVGAGINAIRTDWDWSTYTNLSQGIKADLNCPVCGNHKSKAQTVCAVCYTNILDSRNGFYPDRLSTSKQESISQ